MGGNQMCFCGRWMTKIDDGIFRCENCNETLELAHQNRLIRQNDIHEHQREAYLRQLLSHRYGNCLVSVKYTFMGYRVVVITGKEKWTAFNLGDYDEAIAALR